MSASVISPTDRVILARSRDRVTATCSVPIGAWKGGFEVEPRSGWKGGTGTDALAQPMLLRLWGRGSRAAPTRDDPANQGSKPQSGGRHDEREDSTWRSAPRSVRAHCFRRMGVGASGENGVRH